MRFWRKFASLAMEIEGKAVANTEFCGRKFSVFGFDEMPKNSR